MPEYDGSVVFIEYLELLHQEYGQIKPHDLGAETDLVVTTHI